VTEAVFTAYGAVTGAGDEAAFRALWLAGGTCVRTFEGKNHEGLPPGYGAAVAFAHRDLRALPGGRGLRPGTMTDPTFLAVGAVGRALAGAGIDDPAGDEDAVAEQRGVYLGTYTNFPPMKKHLKLAHFIGSVQAAERGDYVIDDSRIQGGMKGFTSFDFLKLMNNMPTAHAAIQANARGPANTFLGHSSVGLQAIGRAWDGLQLGLAAQFITGGSGPGTMEGLCLAHHGRGHLASSGLDPRTAARPFDAAATGLVPGDAGAAFVLETAANAAARGVAPIARLVAYDERFVVPIAERGPMPDSSGIERLLRAVLRLARWSADEVDLVAATGAGLPTLDALEGEALAAVFGPGLSRKLVVHTGVVGFTEGAHGPLGLVGALQAMQDGRLAPTVGLETPTAALGGLTPRASAESADVRRALVLSVSAEGTLTALAVERAAA
jgi:3-oxoacyl-(acyl-carrier-protein) synthase